MDRRSALSLLAIGMLSACGGGGGGGTAAAPDGAANTAGTASSPLTASGPTATSTVVAGAQPAAQALSSHSPNIACWGDSLTNLYWTNLQRLYANRQVFNGGVIGETSMAINARVQADFTHRDWISVFWYGHNNFTKEPVRADVASSIATLSANNTSFIVMSMLNWATDGARGTPSYNDIMTVNGELAAQYPDNYIDIHAYLVSMYQPDNAQDVQDHNNDLVPSSLRFAGDPIHLNGTGCDLVAAKIRDFISAKQW
jgi:hypothetical protein